MESYYQRNKEVIKQRAKDRYEANKKRCLEQNKAWKAANPEKFKESQTKWLNKHPMYTYYRNAKRRAKEAGVPFDIHYTDIVIPDCCEASGVEFDLTNRELSPSLDRINPALGYTKDNIAIITLRMNRLKNDGTADEHETIANYIRSRT